MKKITRTHVFFVAVSFCIFTLSSCSSIKKRTWNDEVIVDKKYRDFAGRTDAYLQEAGFQGAVLVGRGDKIVFAKGYGLCDVKAPAEVPIGINTTFEAGSITKQMTAAAVMQLVQAGKLATSAFRPYRPHQFCRRFFSKKYLSKNRSKTDGLRAVRRKYCS